LWPPVVLGHQFQDISVHYMFCYSWIVVKGDDTVIEVCDIKDINLIPEQKQNITLRPLCKVYRLCKQLLKFSTIVRSLKQNIRYQAYCCSNHSPEQHLWYAYFSKALSWLSSSEDYKRTQQGALTALLPYLYKLQVVYATTMCLPHIYSVVTV